MEGGGQGKAPALIFQRHLVMEVREAEAFFGVWIFPFTEKTDRQTAKHAQDPDGILVSDAAAILLCGDIQALMESIFDAPILALEFEPVRSRKVWAAGEGINGFGFSSGGLAVKCADLSCGRKSNLFRSYGTGAQGTRFLTPTIFFMSLSAILRRGSRGKKPPEWRS